MKYSPIFYKTIDAINKDYRIISQVGGTRSGKTVCNIQIIDQILEFSKKPLIATCAGMTSANLEDGAISDYEKIVLHQKNIDISKIRKQNPYTYKRGVSTLKFFAFDKPGKAHGPQRDILQLNECNFMPWATVHHLIGRTGGIILLDYNPSNDFWIETQGINKRSDFIEIHSTFLDNIENLSEKQLSEMAFAKEQAKIEEANGIDGYWSNYWRVYGLGLKGKVVGIVYPNWTACTDAYYDILPYQEFLGLDWGYTDNLAIVGCKWDYLKREFIFKEYLYKTKVDIDEYFEILINLGIKPIRKERAAERPIICDSEDPGRINYLTRQNFDAYAVKKPIVQHRVAFLQAFKCQYTESSTNIKNEASNYIKDEKGDFYGTHHLLDGIGYSTWTQRNKFNINPLESKK